VPLGIFAARRPRLSAPLVALANLVQTVPSLAMFGFLLPLPLLGGVGPRAAVVVLILYGLLPIVRTTIAGLQGIDRSIREAGVAMGMTAGELLRQVELPLAMPSIVAGIRVAAVVGVGSATIAAAIGAGGLGEYIYRGLSMVDTTVILAGAIPAAALALVVDGGLLWLERLLVRRGHPRRVRALAVAAGLAIVVTLGSAAAAVIRERPVIVVGSKNFTEQLILGDRRAGDRARDRAGRRPPTESRRHVDLRARAGVRRHRRLRRVHRHCADRHLPPAADQRFVRCALERAGVVRELGPDAAGTARFQQHLHYPRPRQGRG
jgi:osmoprotectant transport system permease protein